MKRAIFGRTGAIVGAVGLSAGMLMSTTAAHAAPASSAPVNDQAGFGHLDAAQAASLGHGATQPVIVIFKNQLSNLPASPTTAAQRDAAAAQIQAPVVAELRQLRAAGLHSYSLVNAVSAKISSAEESRLRTDPAVSEVVPDQTVQLNFTAPKGASPTAATSGSTAASAATASTAPVDACQPGPNGIELDPQALEAIHANSNLPGSGPTAASLGITGAGVKVAFIAEGFDVNQPNFIRPNGSPVVVDEKDFTGEGVGTDSGGEASLDASSIAAQGTVHYTITLPNGQSCTFRVLGAAPGVSLVGLKAFATNYDATSTSLLEAIDYAVDVDHVNVLNESFGYNPLPDTMTDVVRMADEAAVAAGTVVDVSSGDAGPTSTVGSPSTDPAVIGAGASTTYRVYAQEPIALTSNFNGWENDNLSSLSGSGFTEGLKGPNLLAPGDLNWDSCNPAPGTYEACVSGGTSEAAPLTSATAALVIQAYRKTHGGATPTPALVKQIITSTTTDLGLPADQQGSGLLNSYQAVVAAESIKTSDGTPKAKGTTLQTSTDLISATAPAGTTVSQPVTITNSGATTQTVKLSGRILSAPTTIASKSFTTTASSAQGKYTFQVPAGTSYLTAHAATVANPNGFLDIDLIDPQGRLAIDGLPQGDTLTSNVGVRYPEAGTWTAYVTYEGTGAPTAPVAFDATGQTWQAFGTVSPSSLTLAPGASGTATVSVTTPAAAGDETAAVQLNPSSGQQTSIPIALRSLITITGGKGSFSAQVFGGNGRGGGPAATQFFELQVPAGEPELNVGTEFFNGPDNDYSLLLISPQGEALGHASNQLVVGGTSTDPVTTTEDGAVSHVLDPAAGLWTVIVAFANPASGTSVSAELKGLVDFTPVTATAKGLPDSSATTLPTGTAKVVAVTIKNTTSVPQSYFLDARLDQSVTETLTPLTSATGLTLPLALNATIPQWIVPTDTTSLLGQVTATAPVTFDMSPYLGNDGGELNGDPQITATSTGDAATASWSDTPVTPGDWNLDPALLGVFGATGTTPQTANLSLQATTMAFDPAVSTTYGDLWQGTGNVAPVIVQPGQSTTLYATIDPSSAGAVSGTIYVDTASSISPFGNAVPAGDQVAALPYSYTAG